MAKSDPPDILLDSYSDESDEGELTVEDAVNLAVQNSQRVHQAITQIGALALKLDELQKSVDALRAVVYD